MPQSLESHLKQYFGHEQFRPGQRALIAASLEGSDVLGVLATGVGKSICYQLPGILTLGTHLVVSPLIALMRDQKKALRERGISVGNITSMHSAHVVADQLRRLAEGAFHLFYVSPERLRQHDFRRVAAQVNWKGVFVDEAHCASEWSHNFRPDYLGIAPFVARLAQRPVVGAYTATASSRVREDIISILGLDNPFVHVGDPNRPNLHYSCIQIEGVGPRQHRKRNELKRIQVDRLLKEHAPKPEDAVIVYCGTRSHAERLSEHLSEQGLSADYYHADRSPEDRGRIEQAFSKGEIRILAATNAFGMGIDKSNVRLVLHYDAPPSVSAYLQESGRAGRDGEDAHCVLLFDPYDLELRKRQIEQSPSYEDVHRTLALLQMHCSNLLRSQGGKVRSRTLVSKWCLSVGGGRQLKGAEFEREQNKVTISLNLLRAFGLLVPMGDGQERLLPSRSPERTLALDQLKQALESDQAIRMSQLSHMETYSLSEGSQSLLHDLMEA